MKSKSGIFSEIASEAKAYGNTQKRLYKLKGAQKASKAGAVVITGIIVLILMLLTLIFASLALAELFTILWGHEWAGYLSVTVIYVVLIIILLRLLKKGVIQNIVLKSAFQKEQGIKNTDDLEKEINRLKAEILAKETDFKQNFINPTRYKFPLKLLAWAIKTFLWKK